MVVKQTKYKLKNTNSMLPQMEFHKRNKVNMQDINLLIISNISLKILIDI